MSNIETVFGSNGSMKNKAIHVGTVNVYNHLNVEDEASFSSDVTVAGSITAEKGIKIGQTTLTEDIINKSSSGVDGVATSINYSPSPKRMKMTDDGNADYANDIPKSGLNVDTNVGKVLHVNALACENQIVTPTGLLVEDISNAQYSFMLPNVSGTDNLHVDNIYSKKFDRDTSEDPASNPNEIKVHASTLRLNQIGGINGDVTITDGLQVKGQIGNINVDSITVGDSQNNTGDLTVYGDTTFNNAVTFNGKGIVSIPNLKVTDTIALPSNVTGSSSVNDEIQTDKISANKKLHIDVESPMSNVQMVVRSEKVKWDDSKFNGTFYKEVTYDVTFEFEKYIAQFADDTAIMQEARDFFGLDITEWEHATGVDEKIDAMQRCLDKLKIYFAYLKMTHFMCCIETSFTKGDPTAVPPTDNAYTYGPTFSILNPLVEHRFIYDVLTSAPPSPMTADYCRKQLYMSYRYGSTIGKYFAEKCEANKDYFLRFGYFCDHVITEGCGIVGNKSVKVDAATLTLNIEIDDSVLPTDSRYAHLTWSDGIITLKISDDDGKTLKNLPVQQVPAGYNAEDVFIKNMLEYLVINTFMAIKRDDEEGAGNYIYEIRGN